MIAEGNLTTMHKLRHPIALFIITVQIAIGVGVGVVAVTQTSKAYGPSWGQFTASFSGKVYVQPATHQPGHTTSFIYANQPWSGWVAYSPLGIAAPPGLRAVIVTEGSPPTIQSASALRRLADGERRLFGPGQPHISQANGFTVVTIGPRCAGGPCQAQMIVSNGRVVWDMLVFSNESPSTVESFLASFQAIS